MHDTDTPSPNGSAPDPALVVTMVPFQHPPGFRPVRWLIMGIQQDGTFFQNGPTIPSEALAMGLLIMQEVTKQAILKMQADDTNRSRIVAPPSSVIPPWRGPGL